MAVIRNIRGGTVGLNEEDRLMIARLLVKAGYAVKIGYRTIPGNAKTLFEGLLKLVRSLALQIGRSTDCGFWDILRRTLNGKSKRRLMLPTRRCLSCTTR